MIWEYLETASDAAWYVGLAGMFVVVGVSFTLGVDQGRRLLLAVDLFMAANHGVGMLAALGLGNIGGAVLDALLAVVWLYWWWRGHDDDWKKRRRKSALKAGEKGKAVIRRMIENLKPVPQRGPVPAPV